MKKILFSGIGDTDPFRDDFDGSMLHIVRKLRPNKVYLYFTKEMYDRKNKLSDCVNSVYAIDENIEIVILPKEEEMVVEAHDTEVYIEPFKKIINNIIEENENCEILLNISSGTPSMKDTMLLLYLFDTLTINKKTKIEAIQVSSPNKKSNSNKKIEEAKSKEEIKKIVKTELLDNLEESDNRIMLNNYKKLKTNFLAKQITSMINEYQYVGAYLLLNKNENIFDKEIVMLISHLKNRSTFNIKEADNILIELGLTDYIIQNVLLKRLVEYLNIIKIKKYNQSYHDTVIMIVALMDLIFIILLKKIHNIDIDLIINDKRMVDLNKVDSIYPQIKFAFENIGNDKHLKSYHLTNILNKFGHNEIIGIYEKIKGDRHNFAHEVDINTYDKINHDLINKSLKIIDNNIRYIFKDEYKKEYENIYNNLNEILIRKLWE